MSTSILTLNATGDAFIVDGSVDASLVDDNFGGSSYLWIGLGDSGVWRILLDFPLNGLNGNVVNAFLRMVFGFESNSPIRCTSVGQTTPGCPTVHTITTEWGEGDACTGSRACGATSGESSWLHSEFPTLWNSPGGDFNSNPIGQLSPPSEYSFGTVFEFPLNVTELQRIIDNETPYFGFILRDDGNTGFVSYRSREWGTPDGAFSPQLVLEMSAATANPPPTRAPTRSPTFFPPTPRPTPVATSSPVNSPTLRPTTNTVDSTVPPTVGPTLPLPNSPPSSQGQTTFTCADFQQDMVFTRMSNSAELLTIRRTMERELQQLTSSYLPGFAVTTTANVDNILQLDMNDINNVPATSTYELCYTISVDDDGVAEIEKFPGQFVSYLQLNSNRSPFEDRLQAAGIPIVDGSLEAPTLLVTSTETKSSNAAAIGGAVAGVVVLLAVAVVLYIRRRNASSQPDLPNTRSDDLPEDELSPLDDNVGPTASNIPYPTENPHPPRPYCVPRIMT